MRVILLCTECREEHDEIFADCFCNKEKVEVEYGRCMNCED